MPLQCSEGDVPIPSTGCMETQLVHINEVNLKPSWLLAPPLPCCVQLNNSVLAGHRLPTAQEVTVLSVCP